LRENNSKRVRESIYVLYVLVATTQKPRVLRLSRTLIKWRTHFFLATDKTIVAKVVGDGVIQNLAKYGVSFKSFPFQKAKP
jgi:hypothetical protein